MSDLTEDLKRDEGFKGVPYDDTEGQPTIGYGTLLPLTMEEGTILLEHRLRAVIAELHTESVYGQLPYSVQRAMGNMAYNLGVPKLKGFKRMWAALYADEFLKAGYEAWNSRWRQQVGRKRSSRIITLILQGGGDELYLDAADLIARWEEGHDFAD